MQTPPCASGVDLIERISSQHLAVTWRGSESCREQSPCGTGALGARPKLEDTGHFLRGHRSRRAVPFTRSCPSLPRAAPPSVTTGRGTSCLPRDPHSAWERRLDSLRAVPSLFLLLEFVCVARPHRGFSPTTFQSEPDETDGFPQLAEKRGLD